MQADSCCEPNMTHVYAFPSAAQGQVRFHPKTIECSLSFHDLEVNDIYIMLEICILLDMVMTNL